MNLNWNDLDREWKIKYYRLGIKHPLFLGPYNSKEELQNDYFKIASRKNVEDIEIRLVCPYCSQIYCDLAEDACDAAQEDAEEWFDSDGYEKEPFPGFD